MSDACREHLGLDVANIKKTNHPSNDTAASRTDSVFNDIEEQPVCRLKQNKWFSLQHDESQALEPGQRSQSSWNISPAPCNREQNTAIL